MNCRHCGRPIREGEASVDWPWIHKNGLYRCIPTDQGTKAEPAPPSHRPPTDRPD